MTPIKRATVRIGVPIELPGVWALIDWKFLTVCDVELICEVPYTERPNVVHTFVLIDLIHDTSIPAGFNRIGCRRGQWALYYR